MYQDSGATYKFKALNVIDPKKWHHSSASLHHFVTSNIDPQNMTEGYGYVIFSWNISSIFKKCSAIAGFKLNSNFWRFYYLSSMKFNKSQNNLPAHKMSEGANYFLSHKTLHEFDFLQPCKKTERIWILFLASLKSSKDMNSSFASFTNLRKY